MPSEDDPVFAGPYRHVTAQGEEAEALRRERDLLSAVLDTAGALVVLFDREGRIVRFNRACETTTGYSFEEVRGKALWDLFLLPEEMEPVRSVFERLRAGQFPNEHENYWLTKVGGRRLIAWTNTALLDANGAVEYVVGTGIDLTERRQAEESLRKAHDALESRVAERTAELQRANEFLAALHGTALGIVSRLDLNELLEALVTRAANLVAGFASIYLVDHGTDELVARVASGPYRELVGFRLKRGAGLCGKVWQLDRPLWVDEYNTWEGRAATYPYPDPNVERSMGVPLHSGQEVVGVLGVSRPITSPPFQQDEVDIAIRLAQLASIGLDNARLYTSLQQGLALEELIGRISAHFINLGPSEIDAGIQYALQAVGEFSRVDRSYIFQFSGDGTTLDNTHEWCAEGIEPFADSLQEMPRAAFPWFLERLERSEAISLPRVAEMPPEASAERSECEREGIQSIILVPLVYRGMLVGFLGLDSVRAEKAWTEDTTTLLTIVGGLIVNALEHKRAQAIQAGQRQFLELLATGGTFAETLRTLVRIIESQWPGMLGLILLLDEDGKHLHIGASVSLPKEYVQSIEGLEIGPMVGSCGTACYRRERVIVEDTATDPRWDGLRDLALEHSLRACWSEPVFSPDGRVVGTFAMYYRQPRTPTEAELRTIEMGAHLVGVAIEHRRAEQALRESEEKFRGIVELANVGIAIVLDSRFRFVNQHWASMLGYTVGELLGREFMPYCTPEERERIVDFYTRRTRGEPAPTRYETVMLHRDGTRVYADVSVGMIPYEGRQATFVFLRDITEQKRVEDALRQSELRFRAVFEGAPIGVSVTSLEGQLLETNRALQQMFGYTGQEFYKLDVSEFSHPEDMAVDAGLFYGELVPGKRDGYQLEKRFIRRNGEIFWGRLSLSLARGDQGEPLFAIATTEDITAQKQAQEALRQAYQTLEQRVEERTAELAVLNSIAAVASGSLDLKEIMSAALDKTLEALSMEFGTAYGLEGNRESALEVTAPDLDQPEVAGQAAVAQMMQAPQGAPGQAAATEQLSLLAYRGVSAEYAEFVGQLRLPGTATALAGVGKPFVWLVEDTVPPGTPSRRFLEREGCRQVVTLPLIAKGNLVGAINLGARTPRAFTPEQLSLLAAIGQQIGVAVENARLYEAEQDRREEAERRRQVAEGLREILAVLNSRQPLNDMLDVIASHACQVLGSDATALLRLDKATGVLRIQAACHLDAEYTAEISMPLGVGTAGRALAERRPVVISDTAEAMVYLEARGPDRPEIVPDLLKRLTGRFRALFSVPIIVKDEAHGAITFYYCEPHSFSEEEFRLALSVADQAALALENARLREQAEQSAAMEERGRLARELHDSVTQSLYSVTMYTEAAARLMSTGQEAAAEYLRDARDTAQEALREMRLLIYQLRPPVLEKGGLAIALQVRLDAVERRGGIHAELMVDGEDRLPPAAQAELHQIAQEALNNALKHAHAHQVRVDLHFGDAVTHLQVQDDGVGFDPVAARAGGGLGLPGMVERAAKIGARLEIESAPGRGTKILVEVPSGGGE